MPSQYRYIATIRSEYFGVNKVIRAMTQNELTWLIEMQRRNWDKKEKIVRGKKQKMDEREAANEQVSYLKHLAETNTVGAKEAIDAYREILTNCLNTKLTVNLDYSIDLQLFESQEYPSFVFDHQKPDIGTIRLQLLGPAPVKEVVHEPPVEEGGFLEIIFPWLRTKRLSRNKRAYDSSLRNEEFSQSVFVKSLSKYRSQEREVICAFNAKASEYNTLKKDKHQKYKRQRKIFYDNQAARRSEWLATQKNRNDAIISLRERLQLGSAEAIETYVKMILEKSKYPEPIDGDIELRFDEHSKTLVVCFWLPRPEECPKIVEYNYIQSRNFVKPIEMKPKEFEKYFDDVICQIGLRTIHEIYHTDYSSHIESVVFNGWVRGTDPKTGKPFTACVLSVDAPRLVFLDINLKQVVPKDCIRGLKGITAGPLTMMAPVKPIMDLDKNDSRFIESKDVLENMQQGDNLAAMAWEDFEHLIRQLFEKVFSNTGGEVKITQASRDRGVDAIAFDPDPIRGGKFIIQAKRYNMVVPVSAVRDLYGTMINEGAVKGILVTTSHYGRDSREFAKDKPLTLIDGDNLVHMFHKHGHNFHIALLPKGDPRRGL